MTRSLFVYGTLRPDAAAPGPRSLVASLRSLGGGKARGRLYDLGPFPGAVFDRAAAGHVRGEVLELPPGGAPLARLDDYEGFDRSRPGESLFVRRLVPVRLDDGRRLNCWAYEYHRDPGDAPLLTDGRYPPEPADGR